MEPFFQQTLLGVACLFAAGPPLLARVGVAGPWGWLAALVAAVAWAGRPRTFTPTPRRTTPESLEHLGVGSTDGISQRDLYLDLIKRAVMNLLYEDIAVWRFSKSKEIAPLGAFDAEARVRGEDMPTHAHTMIGKPRLDHLQDTVQDVLDRGVPGDLIETGVLRGGASLLMKAVLRSNGADTRRVFLCDTFAPAPGEPPFAVRYLILPIVRALASIPHRGWLRRLFLFFQRLPNPNASFPRMENPSEDTVSCGVFLMRYAGSLPSHDPHCTTVDGVRSTFARYGLLDDTVHFLKGFFHDTLPPAVESGEIDSLAVIRLDGDTYESTITALEPLYPRLSLGGVVIVDDYGSFVECARAIDEYRQRHGIKAQMRPVPNDSFAVYWVKEK